MATRTAKTEAAPDVEDLVAQLSAIRADVAALTAMMGLYGKDQAQAFRASAESYTDEATAKARKMAADLLRETETVEKAIEDRLHAHPVQGLLMAFGVGVLISLLLRR
ncbi:MAG: hypothetical protein WCC57_05490 [Paracoccaceae bacterium]